MSKPQAMLRKDRRASRQWYIMPVALFILGMISIAILVWIDKLSEKQRRDFSIANALMSVQIKAAASHLWLEEILSGDTHEDIGAVWKDIDSATNLAEGVLNGGQANLGLTLEPLKDSRLRSQAEEIESLLVKFKWIAVERYRQPNMSGIGSPLDDQFDKLFIQILQRASILEDLFEKDHIASHAKRKHLFLCILFAWASVVVVATLALWTREMRRKAAEEALETSNEQLSRHESHLLELVDERTAELMRANKELRQKIVECQRAEEVIRSSEERYRLLFNSGNDAVFVHPSLSGEAPVRFIEVNDIACKRLGYSREELLQMGPLDINAPDALPDVPWIMEQLATQGSAMWEGAHIAKEGRNIPVEINNHFFELDGKTIILATARDITERKQAEAEHRRIEAQLRQAQKMEAMGTLAGGIAHDFNNILGAIMGYSEIALLDIRGGNSLSPESLDPILKAARRAKDLVTQILAFSRQSEQELKPTWIGSVIKEALKLLRASLPATIEIVPDIRSKGAIMADPTQIHQVLMNLCTNASHAMWEKGGVLEVKLVDVEIDESSLAMDPDLRQGAYLKLTVSDTGKGIAPEIMERIFEPFFTTKKQGEGTGLGLAVVHGIVKAHEGVIDVRSEPGAGTVFSILFPRIETDSETASSAPKPLAVGNERILFVDDEPALALAGKQILERLGYRVVIMTSSNEALEAFRSQSPEAGFDLVITDMTMPHMTGLELATELNRLRPGVPIIMCTGYSQKLAVEHTRNHGLRGVLMKPLAAADLADAVRRALDE